MTVERIAKVIEAALGRVGADLGPVTHQELAEDISQRLRRAGFGHVPTALYQAADAWQQGEWADTPRYPEIAQDRIAAANHVTAWLRARADQAGGTA